MAIQRVTPTTAIEPGQWALETSMMMYGICGHPRKVTKVSGQRIYLTNRHEEDNGKFIARKSIVFVCDTKEEAEAVHMISKSQYLTIEGIIRKIKDEFGDKINALIAGAA